jgi:HD-GYP domain-containing protein (c-di-GMP phosphodiesterase class II)
MPTSSKRVDTDTLRQRIIGLGEKSIHKSYYPELQNRLSELERFHSMLEQGSDVIFLLQLPQQQIIDFTSPEKSQIHWTKQPERGLLIWDVLGESGTLELKDILTEEWHTRQERLVQIIEVNGTSVELVCSPVLFEGQPYVILVAQEISERLKKEERIKAKVFQLNALHSIDMLITANLPMTETLNGILEIVRSSLEVDAAAVFIFDTPDVLQCEAWSGIGMEVNLMEETFLLKNCPVLLHNQVLVVQNTEAWQASHGPLHANIKRYGFSTYVGVAMVAKGVKKGILEIYHRQPIDASDEWLEFLKYLAGQVAVAVDSTHTFSDLQSANRDLQHAYDATLSGWSTALELRERETAGHSERVVKMTLGLAQAMGIHGDDLVHIRRGALLHDIGKMGIPDSILLKPGPLLPDEWVVMRQHPVYAFRMLSPIEYLRPALDIPYHHHEKWDGTGYPGGLKGQKIPLATQIFTIVDVWDALMSDRPYRPAWSTADTLEYIKDNSGKHFNPSVVDAFLKYLQQ